jgi:hypothetical protein
MKINKTPIFISIVMLFLAIIYNHPYGYYQILRFVICGTTIYLAYQCYNYKYNRWLWLLGAIIILFNPLIPIHMDRDSWQLVDTIIVIIFCVFLIKFRKNK